MLDSGRFLCRPSVGTAVLPVFSVPWVGGILENPGDDAERPPGLGQYLICQITAWRTINSVYIPRMTDSLPRAAKEEDLKAAVEMNPDTKEKKAKKGKKTSVSIHAVQQQGGSLLVSTRLIARFISEKPSESD